VNVSSNEGGIVEIDEWVPVSYPFIYGADSGEEVNIEAESAFGYVFTGWSGDLFGTDNPTSITLDCDKSITAHFSLNWTMIGSAIGSVTFAGLLGAVLIIRRRH
jgi:uncharacterized repeat protein (TIGR02543 family)